MSKADYLTRETDRESALTVQIDRETLEIEGKIDMTTITVCLFHGLTQTPANNVKGRDRHRNRAYSPDRQRDSRDRRQDRYDRDDSMFIPWANSDTS